MKPKHSLWLLLTTMLIISAISINPSLAPPDPSAVIYVDPSTNTVPPGQYFTIKINISNVVNLNFWDIKLQYNTEVLFTNGSLIDEGPFLASAGEATSFNKYIGSYYIQLGCMIMAPVGASGSGTLATMTFLVQKKGSSSLDLYDTKLYDPAYPSPGSEIVHTATDGYFIYVSDVAVINITVSPTTASVGEPVYINATVENEGNSTETFNVTAYYDSTPIETQKVINLNPKASLTQSFTWNTTGLATGTYAIKVNASVVEGETDTLNNEFIDGEVTLTLAPKALFTFSPSKPIIGEAIAFNASASFDPNGLIVSYAWAFGDGGTDSGKTTTHTYTSFGTYTVTLNVTDNEGLWDIESKFVSVKSPPEASFAFTPSEPTVNEMVTFNASASQDPDGMIASYKWDFGDNNITTTATPIITHTYAASRNYTVTLTVTDNEGFTDTQTKTVTVQESPSNILLYAAALIVVAVVLTAIAILVKTRKPKPT